jgi:hypothetical protein
MADSSMASALEFSRLEAKEIRTPEVERAVTECAERKGYPHPHCWNFIKTKDLQIGQFVSV